VVEGGTGPGGGLAVMDIMSGRATDAQIAAFLTALRTKTVEG
jgi:anthranilate phosphoribosyltransferase